MHARVSLLRIGPGKGQLAERLNRIVNAALTQQHGFREAAYLVDVAGGEWGCVSYWDAQADAAGARAALSQAVAEALAGATTLEREPNERIMEVVQPTS